MQDYDRLPPQLRKWVSDAVLPWRAKSVLSAYEKALKRSGDPEKAMEALNALQQKIIAKDASKIWGATHPNADRLSQ